MVMKFFMWATNVLIMFRLTLIGFLRVLQFSPVTHIPSYLHLLCHIDKSAKPVRTFKLSGVVSDIGQHWAEKCFHGIFYCMLEWGNCVTLSCIKLNFFPLKLSIFTRIICTTRDGRKHIMGLPLIEHTTVNVLSLPGREPLIFLQHISITTECIAEGNKRERLCRVLVMYKIKSNKCSLILLASYTCVVVYWGGGDASIDRMHCNNWLQKRRGGFGHEWSSGPAYVCCITDPSNSGLSAPVNRT
jgi:hypothetical protein